MKINVVHKLKFLLKITLKKPLYFAQKEGVFRYLWQPLN